MGDQKGWAAFEKFLSMYYVRIKEYLVSGPGQPKRRNGIRQREGQGSLATQRYLSTL